MFERNFQLSYFIFEYCVFAAEMIYGGFKLFVLLPQAIISLFAEVISSSNLLFSEESRFIEDCKSCRKSFFCFRRPASQPAAAVTRGRTNVPILVMISLGSICLISICLNSSYNSITLACLRSIVSFLSVCVFVILASLCR